MGKHSSMYRGSGFSSEERKAERSKIKPIKKVPATPSRHCIQPRNAARIKNRFSAAQKMAKALCPGCWENSHHLVSTGSISVRGRSHISVVLNGGSQMV